MTVAPSGGNAPGLPIWRIIVGGVAGYVATALTVLVGGILLWLVMGVELVYEPGTYRSTPLFEGSMLALSFGSAIVGGFVAARIGRRGALLILVVVVLVGGLGSAVAAEWSQSHRQAPPSARPRGPLSAESMQTASENVEQSAFYLFGIPIVGLAGVLTGGALQRRFSQRRA